MAWPKGLGCEFALEWFGFSDKSRRYQKGLTLVGLILVGKYRRVTLGHQKTDEIFFQPVTGSLKAGGWLAWRAWDWAVARVLGVWRVVLVALDLCFGSGGFLGGAETRWSSFNLGSH